MIYLLIKSLHVCAVIFWIGGMLLQCIQVVAGSALPGPPMPAKIFSLKVLHRWERSITTPAMLLTWLAGLYLAIQGGWFGSDWLSIKLIVVIMLSALHGFLTGLLRRRTNSPSKLTSQVLHWVVPSLFVMTGTVVFLVIIKPL